MYDIDKSVCESFYDKQNPVMAEKDYLECVFLNKMFSEDFFNKSFIFAGGGTISKIYKIGSRIGQDIDLAFSDFEDLSCEHNTKTLNKFKNNFNNFVFEDLKPLLSEIFKDIGDFTIMTDKQIRASQTVKIGRALPTLYVFYSSNLNPKIQKCINIEFIARHYPKTLIEYHKVVPYALNEPGETKIPTVHFSQTFWDKVYALHTINQIGVIRPGLAHHYYDVVNLAPNIELQKTQNMFKDIERYQQIYTTRKIAKIQNISSISLMPKSDDLQKLSKDYSNISGNFIRRPEPWQNIVESLQRLNTSIKTL